MVVCFTGHRPDKLGGYDRSNPIAVWVYTQLTTVIIRAAGKGASFISGGALGVDQWAAEIVLDIGAPLTIARPFPSQANKWPQASQSSYRMLLERVRSSGGAIVDVSPDPYSVTKMMARNQYMVDHADHVIAVWDGTPGGTGNCVNYAIDQHKGIYRINPQSRVCDWL